MTAGSPENVARLADARAHLAAAPAARAAGPGPDPETLRRAYLDLLKLSLCDLAGASSVSVGAEEDGAVVSRELRGDELRLRAAGMDWPLQGLTMIGLRRLTDLQQCVESVVAEGVDGDLIEAGAWRGGASILMRATLDTLGDRRTVLVADSFQGFPAAERPDLEPIDLSRFDFLAVPVDEVRASFERFGCSDGVAFVPGFFEETLARLADRRWAIVRIDGDTYEATRHALRCLYPGLSAGGCLIVDDYGSFEGCRVAVEEFRSEHGISEVLEKIDHTGVRWRREGGAAVPAVEPPAHAPRAPRALARPSGAHVPTARELELEREVARLRERLAGAGVRAWMRRRLGR